MARKSRSTDADAMAIDELISRIHHRPADRDATATTADKNKPQVGSNDLGAQMWNETVGSGILRRLRKRK